MKSVSRSGKRCCSWSILCATLVVVAGGQSGSVRAETQDQLVDDPADPAKTILDIPQQEAFHPITSEQVERGRQAVVTAAGQLDRYLAQSGSDNATAWKRYLKWDDMQREIAAGAQADPRVLGEVLQQYYTGEPGLERPRFVAAREALLGYRRQLLALADDNVPRLYREQVTAIQSDLQSGVAGSGGLLADLTARLEWLEQLGQAPQLVSQIRSQFAHPNLLVSASSGTIGSGFAESVSETTEVNEMILKTHVCGTAHTQGTLTATVVPCDDLAVLEFTLTGVAASQTVGRQSPVKIYSRGVTQVLGRKRLFVDGLGVRAEKATAHCSTDNRICQIQSETAFAANLVEKVAWKRARQQEPIAERISARRAERRLADRMDQQTLERIAVTNTRWEHRIRRPLRQRDIYPRWLRFWTTRDRLQMAALQGRPNQLASPSEPPKVAAYEVLAQVHESMLLNTAVNAIGGLTVTDERAQDLVKEVTGEVPEELQIKQDEDPWAITFDLQRPIRIEFDKDQVAISIRGRRFMRGDQELRQTIQIAASYQLGIENGRARLTRIGDIEVSYPDKDGDRLSLTELRNKTFMTNKFEGLFKKEISGEGLKLSDRWTQLAKLSLDHISTQNGWLTLGWN